MNDRIIAIYGKEKGSKIFHIFIILLLQVSWKGLDIAVNVPFLTTAARQSLHRLLARSQE